MPLQSIRQDTGKGNQKKQRRIADKSHQVQLLAALQAAILPILVFTGYVAVWHVLALGGFLGVVGAFDVTARQAFVVDMIEEKEDLPNAIALNSFIFNGALLTGPAVAGILIAVVGEGPCSTV